MRDAAKFWKLKRAKTVAGLCFWCGDSRLRDSRMCAFHYCFYATRYGFRGAGCPLFALQLLDLFLWQDQRCYLSGRLLILANNTCLDHVVPICDGGLHSIGNVRWADRDVNQAKNRLSILQFKALCREVIKHDPR